MYRRTGLSMPLPGAAMWQTAVRKRSSALVRGQPAARAVLPPVQEVVIHPEATLIEANRHCIEKENDDLHSTGHKQKKAQAGDHRQEHKKNGHNDCDIAERKIDECRLIHWNSPQKVQ